MAWRVGETMSLMRLEGTRLATRTIQQNIKCFKELGPRVTFV